MEDPTLSWLDKAMEAVNWPLKKAGEGVLRIPRAPWVIEKSVGGFVSIANDLAQWSVRPDAVLAEYRAAGHAAHRIPDVQRLDLEHVDKTIGYLAAKYKGIALATGSAGGALGLPGIPADVAALALLNLRAIGEHATYCGFDLDHPQERLFVLNILGLASSPTDTSKVLATAELVRIAQDVAKTKAWKELEQHAFVGIAQRVAKAIGIRLTKAKLAQIIPAIGIAVGGGFKLQVSKADILVLLGDKPIQDFLAHHEPKWKRLSDFRPKYGLLHAASIGERRYRVLPLAHPRQVGALGMHSVEWRKRHEVWKRDVALGLLSST